MRWRGVSVGWIILACALAAVGQQGGCPTIAYATVLDRKSKVLVDDLTAADFRARVHRQPVTLTAAAVATRPIRGILVLDGSGSMQDVRGGSSHRKWELVIDTARKFVSAAPASSLLGVLAFSESQQTIIPVGGEAAHLAAQLEALRNPGSKPGRTPLWDAMHHAVNMLMPSQPGDLLLVITDGGDNSSEQSDLSVRRDLVASGTRVFAFVTVDLGFLGSGLSGYSMAPDEMEGQEALRAIIGYSGGSALFLDTRLALQRNPSERTKQIGLMSDALALLAARAYRLEFQRPISKKPQKFALDVPGRKVELRYPHMLPACGANP